MSTADSMPACVACGKGGDALQSCSACKSVKYCNVTCQKAHRKNHKKECRKRAAQLFDEALFKQPPRGEECPICFLLLPHTGAVVYQACCGKKICYGCTHQMQMAAVDTTKCPFCREPAANSDEEYVARCNKRIEVGDAWAFHFLGTKYSEAGYGLPKDLQKAFELLSCAAELGLAEGHCSVATIYEDGKVVERDLIKAEYHWQQGAMLGNCTARHNLGQYEVPKGNMNRAIKHWIIAAGAGDKDSLGSVRGLFFNGSATKADYEKALRDYQKYMDEVTSDHRDRASSWAAERHKADLEHN